MEHRGAWRMHRRSRATPIATTRLRSAEVETSISGSETGGSGIARAGSAASTMTTSGAVSGDHRAGLCRASAFGSLGKAQAPSPGEALLFFDCSFGRLGDARGGLVEVLAVLVVAVQEFLREIRVVVIPILIRGRW